MPTAKPGTALQVAHMLHGGQVRSGTTLARQLGVSRAAVHKAVLGLRARGFSIEGNAGGGYRLERWPDALLPEAVVPLLAPGALGLARFEHHAELSSTNTTAAQLAREGAPHGSVVVAEAQSGGRGRRGRSFASPSGMGVYLSVVLRPPLPPSRAFRLTLCGAHAVMDAVAALGVEVGLKWPNDVLAHGKKLSGILTELSADMDHIHHAVLGVGVNVNARAEDFPPELRDIATSVRLQTGQVVDRVALCARLLNAMTAWYALALDDFGAVVQRARDKSVTLGRAVRVRDGNVELVGEAVDLDEDGALIVRTDGGRQRVVAGDVEHL